MSRPAWPGAQAAAAEAVWQYIVSHLGLGDGARAGGLSNDVPYLGVIGGGTRLDALASLLEGRSCLGSGGRGAQHLSRLSTSVVSLVLWQPGAAGGPLNEVDGGMLPRYLLCVRQESLQGVHRGLVVLDGAGWLRSTVAHCGGAGGLARGRLRATGRWYGSSLQKRSQKQIFTLQCRLFGRSIGKYDGKCGGAQELALTLATTRFTIFFTMVLGPGTPLKSHAGAAKRECMRRTSPGAE